MRLYSLKDDTAGPQLNLIKESVVTGGKVLLSARFSPDGKQIAASFLESTAVTVVDGNDLSLRFAPDTSGMTELSLAAVSWTQDGTRLAAAGQPNSRVSIIRQWPHAGRGKPSDTEAAGNSILHLRPLPKGSLLFCSGDPSWGVLTKNGSSQTLGASPIADYRSYDGFRVSTDGASIGFGFKGSGAPAQFNVLRRTLLTDPKNFESLQGPFVDGLNISDWNYTTEPKLAGKPLKLNQYEHSRSRAIAKDASFFVLGTDWNLWCFSSKGEQRWRIAIPGTAWDVSLADEDRLVLAPPSVPIPGAVFR